MPTLHFNPSPLTWTPPRPHPGGTFRGTGKLEHHGRDLTRNPAAWSSKRTVAARLIVGFSVGQVPTYTLDDLIEIVARERTEAVGDPSSSFVAQKGIYQHRDGSGVVHEDGAQVFLINLSGLSLAKFTKQVTELAELICREMQQETVIVEIQVNGVSKQVIGVTAEKPARRRKKK